MKIEKLQKSLKSLTHKQKLDVLKPLLLKEKNKKNKKQTQFLIKKIEDEKLILEEEIEKLQPKQVKEQKEEPLEQIVQESIEENPELKKQTTNLKIYGAEEKRPERLYGINNVKENIKYLSSAERKEQEYKFQPEGLNVNRFTQDLSLDESKRLAKEKKKYETGTV
ncbi:MAG: hypothetical protein AABX90_02615 [Nanoarchaeota archaeon]